MHKGEGSIKVEHIQTQGSLAAVVLSSGCLDIHFRVSY